MALEDFKPMMERCSNCSACKWIPFDKMKSLRFAENCPSVSFSNFNTYSARGRFQLAMTMLEGKCDYSDSVVNVIHQCTTCGLCDVSCKVCRYNLEPLDHNIELKCRAVEDGKILPQQTVIMDTLKKEKTMLPGMTRAERGNWAKGLKIKDLSKVKGETLFFPGCRYSYDKDLRNTAQASLQILMQAGVDIGIMGNADMCCAGRAEEMGFRKEATQAAQNNIKAFEAAGVKTIVTPCSDCYHTFKRLYPKSGSTFEVLHVVEYLDRLIKEGKIKFTKSVPLTVTYHDPCHLGRQGEPYVAWNGQEKKIRNQIHTWEPRRPRYNGAYGIYDAPRNVLNSIPGITLVEMERIREYSWCCGAGGGCSETYPEFSAWTAGERIAEANATGAEALVTACPWCEHNFKNAVDENGKSIKVYDIIDLVQQAL
jgi:Fe-S oxidoreductase